MTTGLVLIAAILVLGGVIATVGDRVGMRVGKARLSLFNLRPRKTATLVNILTGSIISAITFAILFAVDDQLRTGVFELEEIQSDLDTARTELQEATREKRQIGRELNQATAQQNQAQRRLRQINRSLNSAIERQTQTEAQLNQTQTRLNQAQAQLSEIQPRFERAQAQLRTVSQQTDRLRIEISQLQSDRQELIRQRDEVREQIAQRDQEIAQRDRAIAEREALLMRLENQRTVLMREVEALEQAVAVSQQELLDLRLGNLAVIRGQTLATGEFRVVNAGGARQAIDQLLQAANRYALQRIRPGTIELDTQIVQITNSQVEQLVSQIQDGEAYVVRILSAGNYVVGEPCVLARESCVAVAAEAAPNRLVFRAGEVVTSTSADPTSMNNRQIQEQIQLLIDAAQFRARQAGILTDTIQIADGSIEAVFRFFEAVRQYNQPVELQAIAAVDSYTARARFELVAVQNGQILFGTQTLR
ncbi:DUF3084 domain-containing protein [Oculatella sp. LEGE 06141]|uniref:DUF3084 domain-containing protein n=1 Tax=Oculatella sp. LEGE 06141 TaxID=1828648 RepID=UPI001882B3FD|nr:DUF3084 domain-containing protein [Oculatella sp. LEGE 06141]MBE9179759.1 DUF3084 domain-containing protein [Oculatella sp. LEGE 06141]